MNDSYIKRAADIIKKIEYLTLATVTPEGMPWNSPVARVYDENLNFYWFSDKENQHSINVRSSGKVYIVIYDSTAPWGEGEGVYIQANVMELEAPEEITYARRIKKGPDLDSPDDFMGDAIRRVYKAIPKRVWINDAEVKNGIFIRDYKVELDLEELKQLVKNEVV